MHFIAWAFRWLHVNILYIIQPVLLGDSSSSSDSNSSESESSSSSESLKFDDGWDDNLIGDDEDRRRLEQMTEAEREQEMFNRSAENHN